MIKRNIALLLAVMILLTGISHASQKKDRIYASPDGKYIAYVVALPKTPYGSGESKIIIKTKNGEKLFSKDYGSETGEHGFGVEQAAWTTDSRFFVYSMSSSGGHQAWHFPTDFISTEDFKVRSLDDSLGPITAPDFKLKAPDIIKTEGRQKDTLKETIFDISLSELFSNKKRK